MARVSAAKKSEVAKKFFTQSKELPLDQYRPNDYNPNRFTPSQLTSLKHGLQTDGWIPSQSLLVWASDEHGEVQNIIIDGEHRAKVAKELGMKTGPVVLAHGFTRAEAKALTIKLDAKRGKFDTDKLGTVVREIHEEQGFSAEFMSIDLGIEQDDVLAYLDLTPPDDGGGADVRSGMTNVVTGVQLFFTKEQHKEYASLVKTLSQRFDKKGDASATVLEALKRARSSLKPTKR